MSSRVCTALQIFRTALDSGEYVHIRNSLIILNKIVKVSPIFMRSLC
jgi:Transcription factor/nuclear export subunit protein 2